MKPAVPAGTGKITALTVQGPMEFIWRLSTEAGKKFDDEIKQRMKMTMSLVVDNVLDGKPDRPEAIFGLLQDMMVPKIIKDRMVNEDVAVVGEGRVTLRVGDPFPFARSLAVLRMYDGVLQQIDSMIPNVPEKQDKVDKQEKPARPGLRPSGPLRKETGNAR